MRYTKLSSECWKTVKERKIGEQGADRLKVCVCVVLLTAGLSQQVSKKILVTILLRECVCV